MTTQPAAVAGGFYNKARRKRGGEMKMTERYFLAIKSGDHVWTRSDTWSADGVPFLIRGGLLEAQRERARAEAYRAEYPEVSEPAKIVEVTLCD